MAQPSQEFPPWLTQQITTLTNAAGEPTETQTSVVYLPLTYYGPSIPLGTEFTWGGLTPPASTSTTSALSTTSVTASTSSLSSALPSSTTIPSSLPPTSLTSTSPTTSVSSEPTSAGGGLPRNQLIGIIIGSILGFVFIFVFILVSYLCCNAKRKKRNKEIEDDYDFVERSPRHSGEEVDPFLQQSSSGRDTSHPQMKEMGVGGPSTGAAGATGTTVDNSLSSNGSSSTGSGYGTVLDRPTISGTAAALAGMGATSLAVRNHKPILSREELRRLSEEEATHSAADSGVSLRVVPSTTNLNDSEEILPLMPPPRLVDSPVSQPRSPSRSSFISQGSAAEAKLMTARRVRAEDLEPRTPPTRVTDLPPTPARSFVNEGTPKRDSWKLPGWLGALPLMGTASSSSSRGHESERLMSSDELQPPPAIPRLGFFSGERPISSVSGRSGTSGSTVYHDANESPYSSSRGTSDIQAPRGVVARSSSAAEMGYRTGTQPSAPSSSSNLRHAHTPPLPPPSAYEDTTLSSTYSSMPVAHHHSGANVDILDMPVPRTEPSFGSLKDSSIAASSSDSHTQKKWPYPPGLELIKVGAWDETEGQTPSPGSYGTSAVARSERGVMDLDERPPSAGASWRTLTRGAEQEQERRATFGTVVHFSGGHESEAASMHTHLSPGSGSGSGSNHHQHPTSSTGSSSSRRARSMLSGLSSSASFSSDSHGRNRSIRGPGALSPIFGQPLSAASQEPYVSHPPVPPFPGSYKPGSPTLSQPAPAVTRTDREELELPWAAGLNENWSPT
ncbi:hypothetical protein PM082_001935 [Marasmius tenuissimus]|nr:hypothetical protein PM082_001935 [Marasmius tenuissimus]